jgi:capsular polysaccharide biosynthesis protein
MAVTNGKPQNGNHLIAGAPPPPIVGEGTTSNTAGGKSTALEELFLAVRRRWHLIAICIVLVTGAAVVFSLIQRDKYTASASLLFQNTQFDQELFGSNFTAGAVDPTREAATNIDLVSLPTVASRTAATLHEPVELIRSEISVTGSGQADVAKISATDSLPSRAAAFANAYA